MLEGRQPGDARQQDHHIVTGFDQAIGLLNDHLRHLQVA